MPYRLAALSEAALRLCLGVAAMIFTGAAIARPFQQPGATKSDPPLVTEPTDTRPPAAKRVVHLFDFEEQETNPDPVPQFWERYYDQPSEAHPGRAVRFPRYNVAGFDLTTAANGSASVKLPSRGGGSCIRLMPGVIPVFPQGEYLVTAAVRTEGTASARALLTARFLDQNQRAIPGGEASSEPASSQGLWRQITTPLPLAPENAAFLQIDLALLQERDLPRPVPEIETNHTVTPQDLECSAWFDHVAVLLVPRTELSATSSTSIFVAPERPTLRFFVRDLAGEDLSARLTVLDLDETVVWTHAFPIEPGGRPAEFVPVLPGLGWFQARLDVLRAGGADGENVDGGSGGVIGSAHTQFIWLPESRRAPSHLVEIDDAPGSSHFSDRRRFGMVVPDPSRPEFAWPAFLPELLRLSGAHFVILPVPAPLRAEAPTPGAVAPSPEPINGFDHLARRLLDRLLQQRIDVTLAVTGVPSELAQKLRVDPASPLALADHDPALWQHILTPLLERYGQRIVRWQIGPTGSDAAFWRRSLSTDLATFHSILQSLVPGPTIVLPWRADLSARALPPSRPSSPPQPAGAAPNQSAPQVDISLVYPASFAASGIPASIGAWRGATDPAPGLTALFELPATQSFSRRDAVGELIKRAAHLWQVGEVGEPAVEGSEPGDAPGVYGAAPRLALVTPWESIANTLDGPRPQPSPQLAVMRTLQDHLAGRRVVGVLAPPREAPTVRGLILAGPAPEEGGRGDSRGAGEPGGSSIGTSNSTGAIVLWNESTESPIVEMYLGDGAITTVDHFGNEAPIERTPGDGAACRVRITPTPMFIEGVSTNLTRFIASFRIEPDLALSLTQTHEHEFVLDNPWPIAITGELQIIEPTDAQRGWTVSPKGRVSFSIPAGGTTRVPVSFAFGPSQESAPIDFVAIVKLASDKQHPPVVVRAPLRIGLPDLELNVDIALSPDGRGSDVVVTATVVNSGGRARTLRVDALAPGLPTQQLPISHLEPGHSAVKRFFFKDAGRLVGKRIRVSVADAEAPEQLNRSVVIP
ncbi:MAG: hypothetical protein H7Y88_06060 [Phycisphaerales bacterium]|nr:hypothetical protein [Phycisphaerales bacterium]